jgi:chromatin remodeling complex protein RSC6
LKELFNTRKKTITMFDLAKLLSPHIGDNAASGSKKVTKKKNPSYEEDDEEYEDEYEDEDEVYHLTDEGQVLGDKAQELWGYVLAQTAKDI